MNKMLFLVLVILIFFTGCVNNTKIEYGNSDLKELLSIDTLVIELDSICLDVYEQGTAIFEDNNSIIFAGYNKHRHSITFWKLSPGNPFLTTARTACLEQLILSLLYKN